MLIFRVVYKECDFFFFDVCVCLSVSRWFCHMDDDNYVILPSLLQLLSSYHHSQDVYLGRASLDHPIEAAERVRNDGSVSLLTCVWMH